MAEEIPTGSLDRELAANISPRYGLAKLISTHRALFEVGKAAAI
jgi:hypothetical protein